MTKRAESATIRNAERSIAARLCARRGTGRPIRHVGHPSRPAGESFVPGAPGHESKPETRPMQFGYPSLVRRSHDV